MLIKQGTGQLFKYREKKRVICKEKETNVGSSCTNTTQGKSFIRLTGLSALSEDMSLLLRLSYPLR